MTTYYVPDLTGANSNYLETNIPSVIRKLGVKLYFENSPIFADSLTITLVDGTSRTLVRGTDWEVQDDDIAETATVRGILENSEFEETLVSSVTIISSTYVGQQVAMTFQRFYQTKPGQNWDDGTPLEFTPDVAKNLITGLADARQQIARVYSPTASNTAIPKLLPFDINKELSGNVITGEVVTVNTIAGAKVIRLANGAFFADSLVLRYNGAELSANSDYLPIVTSPLIDRSTNKSGIYQCIMINGSLAGDVTIDYHAVGGDVTIADINAVYSTMTAISNFLNSEIFITSDTVVETPAFRAMHARLAYLEDSMRRLLTGNPTYGDSNTNNAVTRPIQATDADMHWYTFASLYQVEGSSDIIRADQFKGRIYLPTSKISISFTVDVNIDQPNNPVSMTTDSLVFEPNYVLFQSLSVNAPQYPMVRTVWNQSSESYSGIYLQFGVPLPTLADQMVVEDFSSAESCWILSRLNEFVVGEAVVVSGPSDTGFMLPDAVSAWSNVSSISKSRTLVPEYDNGYLAYSGAAMTVSDLITIDSTAASFPIVLPTYFPLTAIRTLVVTMVSSDSNTIYDLNIPVVGTVDTIRQGRVNFCDSDNEAMVMMGKLEQDIYGALTISLNVSEIALPLQSGVASSLTDIVRYIRVKV